MKTHQSTATPQTSTNDSKVIGPKGTEGPAPVGGTRLFPAMVVEQQRAGVVERSGTVQVVVRNGAGDLLADFGGLDSHGVPLPIESTEFEAAGRAAFLHDLAKLWQVLPLLDHAEDLTDDEIAIAVSTNSGEVGQRRAIESLLKKSGASPSELMVCGRDPLLSRDAGIHAALLLSCVRNGWSKYGYRNPLHPVQAAIRCRLAASLGVDPDSLLSAPDENGLPTFGLSLRSISQLIQHIPERVRRAVQWNPHLSGGLYEPDTDLMLFQSDWFAKSARKGLFVARHEGGLTIVLKVVNTDPAAIRPAFAKVLEVLCGVEESVVATGLRDGTAAIQTLLRGAVSDRGVVWTSTDLGVCPTDLANLAPVYWRATAVKTTRGDQIGTIEARPVSFEHSVQCSAQRDDDGAAKVADSLAAAVPVVDSPPTETRSNHTRMPLGIAATGERFSRHETYLSDIFAPLTTASIHDAAATEPAPQLHS